MESSCSSYVLDSASWKAVVVVTRVNGVSSSD